MNMTKLIQALLQRVSIILETHPDAMPKQVDICKHDDEPGALNVIVEFTSGHMEGFNLFDDKPYSRKRRKRLEGLLMATAAIGCGISSALRGA